MTTFSSKRSSLIAKLVRPLISAGLIFGGLFQMVAPVLAAGTAAGTNIENRASATYTDPANGNTLNAESNAVTATVAEVAGLTNVPAGIVDVNTGSINSNDLLPSHRKNTQARSSSSKLSSRLAISSLRLGRE